MIGKRSIFVFLLLLPTLLPAQVDQYLDIRDESLLVLPGTPTNLSVVDGRLFCYSANLLLSTSKQRGHLLYAEADTAMMRLDPAMDYVVRHPVTGSLFYTKKNSNGISQLYERRVDDMGRVSVKQIQPGGVKISICHPTFSKDGRFMIFSSDDRIGFGGYDLWFCEMRRNKWSAPQNMGHRVNQVGDEINPCIYGDFLIFAAKGRKESFGGYNLYATRLLATHLTGDTVGMIPIGRSVVQMIPSPMSTVCDDMDMALLPDESGGYWVRRCPDGSVQLYSFAGQLRGVLLSGVVTNRFDKVLSNVAVTLYSGDTLLARTTTDADGRYQLYLRTGHPYTVTFAKENYFVQKEQVSPVRTDEELLIAKMEHPVQLARLEMETPFFFGECFGANASTELTESGRQDLGQVVRFLQQNPHVTASFSLACDATADASFNRLLTDQRLRSLREYLLSLNLKNQLEFQNQTPVDPDLNKATNRSVLSVILSN